MRCAPAALLVLPIAALVVATGCWEKSQTPEITERDITGPRGESRGYRWATPQAKVSPGGDLTWQPEPYRYEHGPSVRYIDHQAGSDENPGTREAPWKHHPWDARAAADAAACSGVHTYVFKRGATYRGTLRADESGSADEPIRLTCDPSWGEGQARFHGSMLLTDGWRRATPDDAPAGMPEIEKVWVRELGTDFVPRTLWEVRDGRAIRIAVARAPNWRIESYDDPRSGWWEWAEGTQEQVTVDGETRTLLRGHDPEHLTAESADAYDGGRVWSEYTFLMGTPYAARITDYDPRTGSIRFQPVWGPGKTYPMPRYHVVKHNRYFIEDLPHLLDAPGEFWFARLGPHAGRLYVRLPGDRNPNESRLEVGRYLNLIELPSRSHVEISGLSFRYTNVWDPTVRRAMDANADTACVRLTGSGEDVRVRHCTFEHVAKAFVAHAPAPTDRIDRVTFADNDIGHLDHGVISLRDGRRWAQVEPPMGEIVEAAILRNRAVHVGDRPQRSDHSHAIVVRSGQVLEVAGNVLEKVFGAGIFLYGGKEADLRDRPLIRFLVHHNKVADSLLHTNDWGGIEIWQGGPAYVYNNVSVNPGGYWHARYARGGRRGDARFGFAYYLDGQFKSYLFNNIAVGVSSDRADPRANSAATQEVIGFMHAMFNNTFHRFVVGSRKQPNLAERSHYLGNVYMDVGQMVFNHNALSRQNPWDWHSMAYGGNVIVNPPPAIARAGQGATVYDTLADFRERLEAEQALASSVGVPAEKSPFVNAARGDYRPRDDDSPLAGRGVRYFVPWALSRTVGEWHFHHLPGDPTRVLGTHFYMGEEYRERHMYKDVPRNDLRAYGIDGGNYARGPLEDWTDGALVFNGTDRHCVLRQEEIVRDFGYELDGESQTFPGTRRKTLDMDRNSFLIEAVLRVRRGFNDRVILSKRDADGWELDLDEDARPRMSLYLNARPVAQRLCATPLDRGQWRHLLVEVDRTREQGIRFYVDGKASDGEWFGMMPARDASLANPGDLFVGKSRTGNYFAGAIDFLRIARSTLADARTDAAELFAWQFDGPFLKDFTGRPRDRAPDAGAIEFPHPQ